jgi:hypothetical protein
MSALVATQNPFTRDVLINGFDSCRQYLSQVNCRNKKSARKSKTCKRLELNDRGMRREKGNEIQFDALRMTGTGWKYIMRLQCGNNGRPSPSNMTLPYSAHITFAYAPGGSMLQILSCRRSSRSLRIGSESLFGGTTHCSPSGGKQSKMAFPKGLYGTSNSSSKLSCPASLLSTFPRDERNIRRLRNLLIGEILYIFGPDSFTTSGFSRRLLATLATTSLDWVGRARMPVIRDQWYGGGR